MTLVLSTLRGPLMQAAHAVATAEEPVRALPAMLRACRELLGASGAALLQARGEHLVPLASDGMAVSMRPVDVPVNDGYLLELDGRLEGMLVLAGVEPRQDVQQPLLGTLLDL